MVLKRFLWIFVSVEFGGYSYYQSCCLLVAQSCPTLWDPMDCSPPAPLSILEQGAISSSRGSSQPRDRTHVSCIAGRFFTNWTTREAQVAQVRKNLPTSAGEVRDVGGKIPWREWQPTPVFLPGEFHGQRSLVGYSPWGLKESDMTERLTQTTKTPHAMHSLAKKKRGSDKSKRNIMYSTIHLCKRKKRKQVVYT